MKKIISIALAIAVILPISTFTQNPLSNLLNPKKTTPSNNEIVSGLKEALNVGTKNSVNKASITDGFFKNQAIKILVPPEAQKMEKKLREIGMGAQVDKFIVTLNRAAETASKDAAPIFINAIKQLTITDGVNILKGNNNAATLYLKGKTASDLSAKFKPIVKAALLKVEITKYWNPLASKYNKLPLVQKVNPNLEDYVTQKTLDGLFLLLADEELKIRKDPVARVSDILKKVFSSL